MRLHKKLINQNKNQKLATKLLIIEPADVDLVQRRPVDHQKANTPPEQRLNHYLLFTEGAYHY